MSSPTKPNSRSMYVSIATLVQTPHALNLLIEKKKINEKNHSIIQLFTSPHVALRIPSAKSRPSVIKTDYANSPTLPPPHHTHFVPATRSPTLPNPQKPLRFTSCPRSSVHRIYIPGNIFHPASSVASVNDRSGWRTILHSCEGGLYVWSDATCLLLSAFERQDEVYTLPRNHLPYTG